MSLDSVNNNAAEKRYMERAIELAEYAASRGEVPVGAVIVHKPTGNIIGEGWNSRERDKSPLAHAEIMAIKNASRKLQGWRIVDSEIYVTLEPCPMCAGAIINAKLDRVIFGAYDNKSGSVCSVQKMFAMTYNHKPDVYDGLMENECQEVLRRFFRELRQRKRKEGIYWRSEMSRANERASEINHK